MIISNIGFIPKQPLEMMQSFITLDIIAIILIIIHFGIPLIYYFYMKKEYMSKSWDLKVNTSYEPKIAIIIPTYNEAHFIEKKLNDIYQQDYPLERLELIVVDSASTDGTAELVSKWAQKHNNLKLTLLQEHTRRGMIAALNYALNHVSRENEIIIFTDADAFWDKDALKHISKYFADPRVGAVSTCIAPLEEDIDQTKSVELEKVYRKYFNILRIAESKKHSTPIHNGALIAFRSKLIEKIGGLPDYTGNNDSTPASLIAFMGYRAIYINETLVKEPVRTKQIYRKIRRAQHLILHFIHTRNYAKRLGIFRHTEFDRIWFIEWYLHIVNPWLLIISILLMIITLVKGSVLALFLILLGTVSLLIKQFRTWIINQLVLVMGFILNFRTKNLIWEK